MKLNYLLFLLAFGLFLSTCKDDDADECDTSALTYDNDIKAIFTASCSTSGCHDGTNAATFSMTNYDEAFLAQSFGGIVGAINQTDTAFVAMPLGGTKLDACKIDKITQWIADGAPE